MKTKPLIFPDPATLAGMQAESQEHLKKQNRLEITFTCMTEDELAEVVQDQIDQLMAMKTLYEDGRLEHVALHLAYECLRLAYSAIGTGDVDYCSSRHLESIDASLDWVIRVLSPRMEA